MPPDQKLKEDLPNIKIIRQVDLKPGESIELPNPRGGHASCIIGNPNDYILIFGGATGEYMPDSNSAQKNIKKTLNDMWVYST